MSNSQKFADDVMLLEKLNIENEKEFLEILASIEHDQWMDWAKSLMKGEELSKDRIERWEDFMVAYDKLDDSDKKPDRKYARKVLSAIKNKLKTEDDK